MYASRAIRCLLVTIIALVIGSCAVTPPDEAATANEDQLLLQAAEAEQRDGYEEAARYYLEAAGIASAAKRADYQLRAVEVLLQGNRIAEAQHILERIDPAGLAPVDLARRQIAAGRIALAQNKPREVLETLPAEPDADLPDPLRAEIFKLRADAHQRIGDQLAAVREYVRREDLLGAQDSEARTANQQAIWQALNMLPDDQLRQEIVPSSATLNGWQQLALIARSAQSGAIDIPARIDDWRRRFPAHPASEEIIGLVFARQRQEAERPAQLAVLLPYSGPLSEVADALRDGFIAAHYHRDNRAYAPSIRFYDTGPDPETILDIYRQAVADGADFVVGPLTRQAVNRIAAGGRTGVPTLTLNYSEQDVVDPALFQFGLAPEDEARQVAQRAWLDGHNRALALVPEGEWGQRVLNAFELEWQRFGGTLLESQTYPSDINDFSDQIRRLLNLDESEQRRRELSRVLQQTLGYEPRRRQDVDFVFMAAFPRQARQIRPQLQFHYAGGLPIYSTSHVFSGERNRASDRDIDGVIFCDIPWVLEPDEQAVQREIERVWPERSEQYPRFYALGVDAYDIIPYLNNLRLFDYERYNGLTGVLQLTASNRVYRQLPWARFRNGLPRPYN